MGVQKDTLRAMVRDYHGFELSDEELELIRPALDEYMTEMEKLRGLDLSNVMSGRLLRAMEGGQS